jgi:hypothetical protein
MRVPAVRLMESALLRKTRPFSMAYHSNNNPLLIAELPVGNGMIGITFAPGKHRQQVIDLRLQRQQILLAGSPDV